MAVVISIPAIPDVRSAIIIDKIELTATFPSRIVQIRRFPLLLNGSILCAYIAFYSSSLFSKGPAHKSSKYSMSKLMIPKFNPENKAERRDRAIIRTKRHHSLPPDDSLIVAAAAAVALAIVELMVRFIK